MHGTLVELEVDSRALSGNPLGDAARRLVIAYLPPGHGAAPLPAVYFLHGFTGSARGWTNTSVFAPTVPERIDALVASGAVPPFVGVFPDGMTALGGTQWTNASAVGRYQDYVAEDVVAHVDRAPRHDPEARGARGRGQELGWLRRARHGAGPA